MCGMETDNVTNNIDVLFRSIKIGSKILKNRIIMPAMGTLYAAWNGEATHSEWWSIIGSLPTGGVGMVVVEYAYVHRSGQVYLGQLAIDRDPLIAGLSKLVKAIHEGGAAALQLFHGGRLSFPSATGSIPLAPSPIPSVGRILPKGLTEGEIAFLEHTFVDAASRAKRAGCSRQALCVKRKKGKRVPLGL